MNAIEYYLLYSNAQRTCFAFAAGYVEGRQWGSHFRPWQGIVEIVLSCWKVYLNLHDQHYNVNTKHASHVSLIQMLLTRFQRIVLLVFISVSLLTRNFIWIPIQWMDHVFITASSQTGYLIWTGMYRHGPASEGFTSPEKRLANCVTVTSMCAQGSNNTVPWMCLWISVLYKCKVNVTRDLTCPSDLQCWL